MKPCSPARRRWLGVALTLAAAATSGRAGGQSPVQAQTAAAAPPPEVAAAWPGARRVGSGRLRFMGMRIYESRLWAPGAAPGEDWAAAPFAIEIEYARGFSSQQIAERSLAEMRRQGDLAADVSARWLAQLQSLIPDVREGDRLTGVLLPPGSARFYLNGQPRGEVRDADFVRVFFGIWLSPRTSEPALRAALLGRPAP